MLLGLRERERDRSLGFELRLASLNEPQDGLVALGGQLLVSQADLKLERGRLRRIEKKKKKKKKLFQPSLH